MGDAAMMITPQACRRIAGALGSLPDDSRRERWGKWSQGAASNQTRAEVPYDIASIALDALTADERRIREQLDSALDDDSRADLLNDLGYILSIEAALRNEGIGHHVGEYDADTGQLTKDAEPGRRIEV